MNTELYNKINMVNSNTSSSDVAELITQVLLLEDAEEKKQLLNLIDSNSKKEVVSQPIEVSQPETETIVDDQTSEYIPSELEIRIDNIKPFYSNETLNDIYQSIMNCGDITEQDYLMNKFSNKVHEMALNFVITPVTSTPVEFTPANNKTRIVLGITALGIAAALGGMVLALNVKSSGTTDTTIESSTNSDDDKDTGTGLFSKKVEHVHDTDGTEVLEDESGFIHFSNLKQEEIHTVDMDTLMINAYDFGHADAKTRKEMIDKCHGNAKKVFSYVWNELLNEKRTSCYDSYKPYTCGTQVYGMQFYLQDELGLSEEAATQLPVDTYSYWELTNDIALSMKNNDLTCEEAFAQARTDAHKNDVIYTEKEKNVGYRNTTVVYSEESLQNYQDNLYTLFKPFYDKYGIGDYSYLYDDSDEMCQELDDNLNTENPYIPMINRGKKLVK